MDNERYELTWKGKEEALRQAHSQSKGELQPCPEESLHWDLTQNMYIEGDNIEVLKLLQKDYCRKVKLIYIDPPYNTGNGFVYADKFDTHNQWLNMMYPRLWLAAGLLKDDGVIFISIDDNEAHNLRMLCNEVFGEENFIAQICHKSRASVSNDKIISANHNYILHYAKRLPALYEQRKHIGLDPHIKGFNRHDELGQYKLVPVDGPGGARKGNPFYEFLGVEGYWRYSKEDMEAKHREGLIVKNKKSLQQKYYLHEASKKRRTDTTWWEDGGLTVNATKDFMKLMGGKYFDSPKPVGLITRMLKLYTHYDKNAVILDFFSGSATTAHAVMQQNAEDGGQRPFIMVQTPEPCDAKSEALKAGYANICEIGKERIRRAGAALNTPDTGFRVYKYRDC